MALLLAALFVEAGFVLLVAPWTTFWDRNYFMDVVPQVRGLLTSNYFRGAVSGLGVIDLCAGIAELVAIFANRSQRSAASTTFVSQPAQD
jgi:hypothetical protein